MAYSGCSALHGMNPNYKEKKDSIFNTYFSKLYLHLLALFLIKDYNSKRSWPPFSEL